MIVLPYIPKVQGEEVEHSFEREGEEERSILAAIMRLKLLKIGVQPGQEKE